MGPSIGVGTDMTVRILDSNGEVLHRSIYRALLPEDMESNEHKTAQEAFDASVAIKCGPGAIVEYFD